MMLKQLRLINTYHVCAVLPPRLNKSAERQNVVPLSINRHDKCLCDE